MSRSYLITGATGYIGSMLVKNLIKAPLGDEAADITAIVRNREKAASMLPPEVRLIEADLTDAAEVGRISGEFDYLIHCAAVTKSLEMVNSPVEVIDSIVAATGNVCALAGRLQVGSMVYLSSMEIYGNIDCSDGHRAAEEELGRIDILNTRSCYPMGKRMAENLCCCYYREYGIPVRIARLAQTFGKGTLPGERRAFAQFADAAIAGKDIILHTAGNSMGNYCEIEDAIDAIKILLERGKPGEAYNVVNEDTTMPIRRVAELAAEHIAGGKIAVRYDIPADNRFGYAADTGLRLSAEKLRGLGWTPHKDLKQMFDDLAADRKQQGRINDGRGAKRKFKNEGFND